MKLKKLYYISDALQHHLVYDLFLSQMMIFPSIEKFNQCIITVKGEKIRIDNPEEKGFLIEFMPHN